MGDQVPCPDPIPPILGALELITPFRLFDLSRDAGDDDITSEPDPGVEDRTDGFDVACDGALHVHDSKPEDGVVSNDRIRLESRAFQPWFLSRIRRIEMSVEHERSPAARTGEPADRVGPPRFDPLLDGGEPEIGEDGAEVAGCFLFPAGRAGNGNECHGRFDESVSVHRLTNEADRVGRGHWAAPNLGSTCDPNSSSCRTRFAPQSSSMMWVQPAAR
ncbi:hypothetical protein BMS3Bbin01_03029 [bacterium BMS3Bbin01]|nr:hypothetical protein BMS3Bbin01_03029 [bacterium BMS3Bbin01]